MKKFGPGFLVAAAFIGPGTLTTASYAGAHFGFALLWALLFSILATLVLQEMAARLGLATRAGLAEALASQLRQPLLRFVALFLVLAAVGFGNAAYEAGNIAGAALALQSVQPFDYWPLAIGLLALVLLLSDSYRLLEGVLVGLVLVMSAVFLLTLMAIELDGSAVLQSLLSPRLPDGSLTTAIALIGTTVVPYNLFLHASAVSQKWPADAPLADNLAQARRDAGLSIGLGGLITLAILATAVSAFFVSGQPFSGVDMSRQLEPLLGSWARFSFAAGLFAAGLSSAIAAPLAAAYALCGALGLSGVRAVRLRRAVCALVLLVGVSFASLGIKPVTAIIFAQAFNGVLLPLVAVFLLWVMNQRSLLGDQVNGWLTNALGALVVLTVSLLALWKLVGLF